MNANKHISTECAHVDFYFEKIKHICCEVHF